MTAFSRVIQHRVDVEWMLLAVISTKYKELNSQGRRKNKCEMDKIAINT